MEEVQGFRRRIGRFTNPKRLTLSRRYKPIQAQEICRIERVELIEVVPRCSCKMNGIRRLLQLRVSTKQSPCTDGVAEAAGVDYVLVKPVTADTLRTLFPAVASAGRR